MHPSDTLIEVSPVEYEFAVKRILDATGHTLESYRSEHLETISGLDGEYTFDVVAYFSALGANFTVLVECKRRSRPIERKDVQILLSKLQSVGAQKGMLFSTAGFQQGAIQFAEAHGIALVQFSSGSTSWFTRGIKNRATPWADTPKYVGWWHNRNTRSLLTEKNGKYTCMALGLTNDKT